MEIEALIKEFCILLKTADIRRAELDELLEQLF